MKISTILIYATFWFYANASFCHDRDDLKDLQSQLQGNIKHIIINKEVIKVPEIDLLTAENASTIINFLPNQVTLVNFWATWCAPCREEMPSLDKLSKSVGSDNFRVIVVAAGRNSDETINKFFSEHKLINLESYKDPKGKISSQMSVFGLPTTIIIDQHSNELARLIGGTDWNSEESIKFVNKILDHKH